MDHPGANPARLCLVFRHLSGARATELDVVPIGAHQELILGRAQSAAVRFNTIDDVSVGRHHARITLSSADELHFHLSDLNSRNGTFLNGARVDHETTLSEGDVVQLGEHGPQVEVRIERF